MKNEIKFSLALFGVVNTTTMAAQGNDLSPEMKVFYDKALIELTAPNLVHEQFGQKRKIPRNSGKSIEFRRFSELHDGGNTLTEGVTPNGKALNVTAITATPVQFGSYVELSDVLEMTAIDNTILEVTKCLANQAGRTIDTYVKNVLNSGTNVMYCPNITAEGKESSVTERIRIDSTSRLTLKQIYKAVGTLKMRNVPTFDGYYVGIVHPYVAYDIIEDAGDRWQPVGQYPTPNGTYVGEIGCVGGVRFVETSEADYFWDLGGGIGACTIYCSLILGADAYGVTEHEDGGLENIIKQRGYGNDPLNQRSSIGWKAFKCAKILNQKHLIRVESCSSICTHIDSIVMEIDNES